MTKWNQSWLKSMQFQYRQSKLLPATAQIEAYHGSQHIAKVISTIAMVLFALLVWAGVTNIDEVATAEGEIVPQSLVKPIQHLEGGIVSEILVENGQSVVQGQVLIQLDATRAQAELEQAQSREITLLLESERLKAFLSNQPFDVKQALKNISLNPARYHIYSEHINDLLSDEKRLLQFENLVAMDKKAMIDAQIKKNKLVLLSLSKQKKLLDQQVTLLNQERSYYDDMKNDGAYSKLEYLHVLRDINQAKSKQVSLIGDISRTENELNEANLKFNELKSTSHRAALSQQADVNAQLLQVRRQIERLHDRVHHTTIKATGTGIVKGLTATVGSVIVPGAILIEVVPQDAELIVKAKISPGDIGHVTVGEPVKVKVKSYDYGRYGSVDGVVKSLSASTFEDPDMGPYFEGIIHLSQAYVGHDPQRFKLMTGMTVTADIITGEKTLLQYILKPIHATVSASFHER